MHEFDYYVMMVEAEHRRAGIAGELKRAAWRALAAQQAVPGLAAGLGALTGLIVLTAVALVIWG